MPTTFSITFDDRHGLALVAGETIITDLVGVHIDRNQDGTFSCSVTRGEENPVRLVASATPEGRLALERANGRESPAVPGFVEAVVPAVVDPHSPLRDEIAKAFGWEPGPATPAPC